MEEHNISYCYRRFIAGGLKEGETMNEIKAGWDMLYDSWEEQKSERLDSLAKEGLDLIQISENNTFQCYKITKKED